MLLINCAGAARSCSANAALNSQLRSKDAFPPSHSTAIKRAKCHSLSLLELGAMSGRRTPDPRIADLLELLNTAESFQEIEELLKHPSRPPENSVTPVEGENRFAAKVVSVMSKSAR
jgi:hypothetical protein